MGIQLKWESVEVEALLNDMDTHDVLEAFKPLEQYLEDRPAIYMWKLKADTRKLEEAENWEDAEEKGYLEEQDWEFSYDEEDIKAEEIENDKA